MAWIYLSPHLDDAVFSCGGLIWEQVQAGEKVAIWTICAGDPPTGRLSSYARTLHAHWGLGKDAPRQRRIEDQVACRHLGATPRHFRLPDCIYRRSSLDSAFYYPSESEVFGSLHPSEAGLIADLARILARELPQEASVTVPLTLGGHVDHRLARAAVEVLERPLWYYPDYPYVRASESSRDADLRGLAPEVFSISASGLEAWETAIVAYRSQITSFWEDFAAARASIREYHSQVGGVRLWRRGDFLD